MDAPASPNAAATRTGHGGGKFRPRSSLDYLLRTVQQTQIRHSSMADSKANMMITVSSVVFSVTLSKMNAADLRWPLFTLCAFSLASLVAAILAAMPSGTQPADAPAPGSAAFNLLFFGHFNQLDLEEFVERMAEVTRTDDELYESILRDIYGAGTVLARRKYRRLRISYMCFLLGVFVASIELLYLMGMGLQAT